MATLHELSEMLAQAGVEHEVIIARAKPVIRNVKLVFKSASERARIRRLRKQYVQKNRSHIKQARKKYTMKMRHKKPNPILSKRMKQVAKKYRK